MTSEAAELEKSLYFVAAKEYPKCFAQTQDALSKSKTLTLKTDVSIDDAKYAIAQGKRCLIVLCMNDRDELGLVANALLSIKKEIKERQVIAVIFMKFASEKVEDLLRKTGCSDTLRFDLTTKAFTHKLSRSLKLLDHGVVKDDEMALIGSKKTELESGSVQVKSSIWGALGRGFEIEMTEAYEHKSDFWLFRKKIHAKKFKEFWLIEMIGPSPSAGMWQLIKEDTWKWSARLRGNGFETDPEHWIFIGKKPEYSWSVNRWAFVSTEPSLALMNGSATLGVRFQLANLNKLQVAENSEYAKLSFQLIKATFDQEFRISNEKDEIPWADHQNSKDLSESDWNLGDLNPVESAKQMKNDSGPIKLGAAAMTPCGLRGLFKNFEVSLIEYHEVEARIIVGIPSDLINLAEIVSFRVDTENIGLSEKIILTGTVVSKLAADEPRDSVVTVDLDRASKIELEKIRRAIARKQSEINTLFNLMKGVA